MSQSHTKYSQCYTMFKKYFERLSVKLSETLCNNIEINL